MIRLAGERDREAWESLWRAWQSHMSGTVPDEATERSWRQMMAQDGRLSSLLAFDGDEALGFAVVSRTPFAWTGEDILFLQDFFVSPHVRGRGIGTALLKAVYAHADAVKASQVFWMVDDDDPELQAFYARHSVRTLYHRYMRRGWPW